MSWLGVDPYGTSIRGTKSEKFYLGNLATAYIDYVTKDPSQSLDSITGTYVVLGSQLQPPPSTAQLVLPLMTRQDGDTLSFFVFRGLEPGQKFQIAVSDEQHEGEDIGPPTIIYEDLSYLAPAAIELEPGAGTTHVKIYAVLRSFGANTWTLFDITPKINELIDWTGVGEDLISSDSKIKGLTSLDGTIVFTTDDDAVDLSAPGAIPFFQKDGNFKWYPVQNTTFNLDLSVALKTNVIGQYTDNCIQMAGFTNNLNQCNNSTVIASDNCVLRDLINPTTTLALKNDAIIASTACTLTNLRTKQSSIISCDNCEISTTAGAGAGYALMGACKTCTALGNNSVYLGCENCTFEEGQANRTAVFIGCYGLSATGQGSNRLIHGNFSNGTVLGTNPGGQCILMDNSSTGPAQNFATANTMITRYVNGTTFYSNTAFSQGVTLAPGSSAWASVCDVNKKNILGEVNYASLWTKMDQVPVNIFTYIGDERERKYMGPTAQAFHGAMPISQETFEEEQFDENGMLITDVDGNPVTVTKLKKDILMIDTLDYCGALFSLLKAAKQEIEALKARVLALENPI